MLRAIRDALGSEVVSADYFEAILDDEAEAKALHALHVNRITSRSQ
ncbi:MAG: hypothetical protein ACLP9L_04840 [Thermoguttaceae bacterium]